MNMRHLHLNIQDKTSPLTNIIYIHCKDVNLITKRLSLCPVYNYIKLIILSRSLLFGIRLRGVPIIVAAFSRLVKYLSRLGSIGIYYPFLDALTSQPSFILSLCHKLLQPNFAMTC